MTALAALLLLLAARPASAAAPIDAELAPVVDELYDLQLDSAAATLKTVAAAHPGHPAAAFYASLIDYQRWAFATTPSKDVLQRFEDGLGETERLAEAWIATSPVEGYYYIGAARGFGSRVLADRGHFVRAASPGLRAIKFLRRAAALDPSLVDADLGIGMYDYFRSQMPAAAKPFAFLLTFEAGNRERGIKELSAVAESGGLAMPEARSVLSAIYASEDEREFGKASALLRALVERFPHNPSYRLRLGYCELQLGHWGAAIDAYDPDGGWIAGVRPAVSDAARVLALYRAAEASLLGGHYSKAKPWLDALAGVDTGEQLGAWVALRAGNMLDAEGRRAEGLEVYRKIDDPEAKVLAKRFIETPFPDGPRDVKPWTGFELPR